MKQVDKLFGVWGKQIGWVGVGGWVGGRGVSDAIEINVLTSMTGSCQFNKVA